MIREVCASFREEVVPKLHLLPKQFIHGDANCGNIIVTPDNNFGFIDFADLNYTCRVFELAISLMNILNISGVLSCGRTRMAGHFFAGYQSINPLSDEELQLLHVLVSSRFCQLLVLGAYINKNIDPDNEYVMTVTIDNGWKNFEAFWALRQHGRVVRAPDLKSGGPGFKSRSDHYLNLFSVVPSSNPRSCL